MLFQKSLLALAAAISVIPTASANIVPNGAYEVTTLEDGTSLWTSKDSDREPIKVTPEVQTVSAKFSKRRTDCWGNGLDRTGTDITLQALRDWAGSGSLLTSGDRPHFFGYVYNDVIAYYCITRPHTTGSLDLQDVNHAIREMDAKCPIYTGSWYGWDGSSELVGKAHVSQEICTGPFN